MRMIVQIFVAFSEKLNFNAASKNIYLSTSNKTLYLCFLHHIVIAEQNEIKRRWQKQSIIISKIHTLGRILLLKQENQFFKKERSPVSYIHTGCKLIMKFQGKQGIPTLGSKELKRNADSWDPNGFQTEAKIGY